MQTDTNDTPIRSASQRHTKNIADIIESQPQWLIQWGTTLLFFIVAIALYAASAIQYPQVVTAKLKLMSIKGNCLEFQIRSGEIKNFNVGQELVILSRNLQSDGTARLRAQVSSVSGNPGDAILVLTITLRGDDLFQISKQYQEGAVVNMEIVIKKESFLRRIFNRLSF